VQCSVRWAHNVGGAWGTTRYGMQQEGDLVMTIYFVIALLGDALVLAVHAALAREERARVAFAV
jgi:hypothetical protein